MVIGAERTNCRVGSRKFVSLMSAPMTSVFLLAAQTGPSIKVKATMKRAAVHDAMRAMRRDTPRTLAMNSSSVVGPTHWRRGNHFLSKHQKYITSSTAKETAFHMTEI